MLAETKTRLKKMAPVLQERLINWGYAICDTAMRRHVVSGAPPPLSPIPAAWLSTELGVVLFSHGALSDRGHLARPRRLLGDPSRRCRPDRRASDSVVVEAAEAASARPAPAVSARLRRLRSERLHEREQAGLVETDVIPQPLLKRRARRSGGALGTRSVHLPP